jgi:hypothetical protein
MRKVLLVVSLLVLVGCSPVEQQARDTAAALGGALAAAQTQHQTECTTAPTGAACVLINKAVSAQNALVTSIEAYCGWSSNVLPTDPNTKCVPVSGAQGALNAAISNANGFITQLKGVIQ